MFSLVSGILSTGGSGHVWQGGMHGREHAWQGACMAGGMQGAWQEGCVVGACMTGEMATAADGTHPTGMHSCCF